jgi:tRNA G18 (ribose-2'-O)-methylase SpoU
MTHFKVTKKFLQKKYLKERVISEQHEVGCHDFIIVLDHLKAGYNIAKIFRSANAFGCREVHLVGIESFDVRAAMGTFRQTRSRRFENFQQCYETLQSEDYQILGLAPQTEVSITQSGLAKKTAFVIGHEEYGLSFDPKKFNNIQLVSIPQFGNVESLNVSNAASIVMYEWIRQHTPLKTY